MDGLEQQTVTVNGPHNGATIYLSGEALATANAAIIMAHGRGASAEDMLGLAEMLTVPGIVIVAPEAAGHAWYPNWFAMPTRQNEPYLSSALEVIGAAVALAAAAGIPTHKIILLGFSQGACLVQEYASRNGQRYGGLVGLSGGLIGSDEEPRKDRGNLEGTPVFLGCSDADPYIPKQRVDRSAAILRKLGADVTVRFYPDLGHSVNADEIEFVQSMVAEVTQA